MENTAPEITPQQNTSHKTVYVLVGIILVLILGVSALLFFFLGNKPQTKPLHMAPKAEDTANPQHVKAILGFSILNLGVIEGQQAIVDLEAITIEDGTFSEGRITVKYDPTTLTKIGLRPISGQTGLFPLNTSFSKTQYNPNNASFSFKLPPGEKVAGKGRLAEFTFTPLAPTKESSFIVTYDIRYTSLTNGDRKPIKLAISDLVLSF